MALHILQRHRRSDGPVGRHRGAVIHSFHDGHAEDLALVHVDVVVRHAVDFPHLRIGYILVQGHFLLETVEMYLLFQGVFHDDELEGLFAPYLQKQVYELQRPLFR